MTSVIVRLTASAAIRSIVAMGLLAICAPVLAGTVVLKDGTIIHGEVVSLGNGVYTIETVSLGQVRVPKDQVRSIELANDAASGNRAANGNGVTNGPDAGASPGLSSSLPGLDLQATKSRISADPKLMALLLGLENDPAVLSVVQDPQVMKEMAAGDYTALMSNPKVVALMNNSKVREIIDAVR